MAFFLSKLMKGHSIVIILILLENIGSIVGVANLSDYEDYNPGEDISYDSEDLRESIEGTPETIGELEFDVEVAEQTPDSRQKAPEVLVIDEKRKNKNRKNGKDFDVISEVPVDMEGSSQIGDIQFDIEVADQTHKKNRKRPKTGGAKSTRRAKNFQKLPEDVSTNSVDVSTPSESVSTLLESVSTPLESVSTPLESVSTPLVELSSETSESSVMPSTVSSEGPPLDEKNPEELPPKDKIPTEKPSETIKPSERPKLEPEPATPVLPPGKKDVTEWPKAFTPAEPDEVTVWPVILFAIVFSMLAVIGIIWGVWRLIIYKNAETQQEKQILDASKDPGGNSEAAATPGEPGATPGEPGATPGEAGATPEESSQPPTFVTENNQ